MRTARTRLAPCRFDLLPPSFHYHERVRQLTRSWLTVVCMLLATLCAVTFATTFRMQHRDRTNLRIASAAIPLMHLRDEVIQLQAATAQRDLWCQWVASARPDDDLLQALAAIAKASRDDSRRTMIDSLHIRLPIEYPATAKEAPTWATPHLAISARLPSEDVLDRWLDQLNGLDRIEATSLAENNKDSSDPDDVFHRIRLTAAPRATRVLP
jgi:hypothetical protein